MVGGADQVDTKQISEKRELTQILLGRSGNGVWMRMKDSEQSGRVQTLLDPLLRIQGEAVQRVRRYVADRDQRLDSHAARCSITPQYTAGFIRPMKK